MNNASPVSFGISAFHWALCGAITLTLAACGGGGNDPSSNGSQTSAFDPPYQGEVTEYLQSKRQVVGTLTGLGGQGSVRLELNTGDQTETLDLNRDGDFTVSSQLPVTRTYRISIDDSNTPKDCFHADTGKREVRGTSGTADSDLIRIVCTEPLPLPVFKVSTEIEPPRITETKDEFGNTYPIGRIRFPNGKDADLVARKALVMTSDAAALNALLEKWNGEILKQLEAPADSSLEDLHMVRFSRPDSPPDSDHAARLLKAKSPTLTGRFDLSSEEVLDSLLFTAEATQAGMKVTLPWLLESQDIRSGSTADAATGPDGYTPDAFQWQQMQRDGLYRTGVADAWQTLEFTGNLSPSVDMLILDGGFANIGDFPTPGTSIFNEGVPNPDDCGGIGCRWHGTQVASVAAGVIDNGIGVAGVGAPVIRNLSLIGSPGSNLLEWAEFLYGIFSELIVKTAIGMGPDIVNISAVIAIPAAAAVATNEIVDVVTTALYARGVLIVAAAGNNGENVDAEDCAAFVCWEEETWTPCENDFVLCVGGMSDRRFGLTHPRSNYGVKRRSTVDLYAPFRVYTPRLTTTGDIGSPEVTLNAGTSFSTPFVAGAAALVLRSLASATTADIVSILGGGMAQSVAIESFLRSNGNPMLRDGRRSVNVYRAVVSALEATGEDLSARISIDAPEGAERVSWRSTDPLRLMARHYDPKLSGDPVSLEWRFEGGAVFSRGAGVFVPVADLELGSYTLVVEDVAGDERPSASFTFEVVNDPPQISLASAIPANLCLGASLSLRALVEDPNWPDGAPAASIVWTATPAGGGTTINLGTGPTLSYTELGEGEWTIRVQVTDEFGLSDSISGTVTVAPCADMPPTIQILSPSDGSSFYVGEGIRFQVVATDPEDGDISDQVVWYSNRSEQHPDDNLAELFLHAIVGHEFARGADVTTGLAHTRDGSPHVIKAVVMDSAGNSVTATVVVHIKIELL